MSDGIHVRGHELSQLNRYLEMAEGLYRDAGLDERAGDIADVSKKFGSESGTYELTDGEWGTVVDALDNQMITQHDDVTTTRVDWLRCKLARRAEQDVYKMGYTSTIPIMYIQTGKKPTKP